MERQCWGPDDRWPQHQEKRINEAYKVARGYGWTLTKHNNHATYTLACPTGSHTRRVFSTGRAQESFAKDLLKFIHRCPHAEPLGSKVAEAERHLDNANRILDAAELLLESRIANANVFNMANQDQTADIAELLEEAVKLESKAADRLKTANLAPEPHEAVAAAEENLKAADNAVSPLERTHADVKKARDRLTSLRRRKDRLNTAFQDLPN